MIYAIELYSDIQYVIEFRYCSQDVCSALFYNFLFIYWSMISFVLRIQIGIDLYTIIDKALYW